MSFLMRFVTFLVTVVALPLKLIEAVGLYRIYKRFFPLCLEKLLQSYHKKTKEKKKDLFSSLAEFTRPGKQLSILEIGCGNGANFTFYPSGCKVICTDPNPHFQKYLQNSMAENDHLTFEKFIIASGEDLGLIEDDSVDVVVSTLVLCSVSNVKQTLQEARRILRPGGAFYFMEHVAADPSTWIYFFQHVLQPLWYFFGDGCDLNRETWKDLEAAGFSELKLRHIEAPVITLLKPHVIGYAIK
ncbi:thiol S-methyltransferase TMT1A-like [Diretmus argenteus]